MTVPTVRVAIGIGPVCTSVSTLVVSAASSACTSSKLHRRGARLRCSRQRADGNLERLAAPDVVGLVAAERGGAVSTCWSRQPSR
jgi:hypothetical protein